MTETRPAPEAPSEAPPPLAAPADPPGITGWLSTSDHKRIGRLWIATSLLFLVVGGVAGALLAGERVDSGLSIFDEGPFSQVYTMHGEVAVLLFLVPLFIGLATLVVPLQVGSPEIAFPRGAATGYWTYLVSGGLLLGAYAADGGHTGGDSVAVDLWLLALVGVLLATLLALVSLLTTILTLRAGGMTLLRTPSFSWSILVGGGLTLLTAPVLVARLIDMYVAHHFGGSIGNHDPNITWFWTVPHVYLLVVPAAGVALEVVPVLARNRVRLHAGALVILGLLGVVGLGAWAQVPETFDDLLYVAIGVAAVIPALALLGLLGDTLRGGRAAFAAPLLLAMGSVLLLLLGAIAGALLVIEPLELQGTVWEVGHTHLVLLGAGTLAGLAGLWYWAPKIWGVQLSQGAGVLAFLGVFFGALLLGGADLVNGLVDDVPLASVDLPDDGAAQVLNGVSAAGGVLAVLGALAAVLAVLGAARSRRHTTVADDPWGGHTLEWATTSPPPPANFAAPVPAVTSATPLLTEPADHHGVPA